MFDKKEHPRDTEGLFIEKNQVGEAAKYDNLPNANRLVENYEKRFGELASSKAKKQKTEEEFFGEEFKGVTGAAAVEKLLLEKRGHVKNAFMRPEIGGIDLVWGDEKGGLFHLILKRDKLYEKGSGTIRGLEMARMIPEILEKGEFNEDDYGRINIDYNDYRVGVMPAFYNKKVNWIVTAMEKRK